MIQITKDSIDTQLEFIHFFNNAKKIHQLDDEHIKTTHHHILSDDK